VWVNLAGLVRPGLVFYKAASLALYVQPRSRKIRSKIGIGIPRSQSKMYPVAPACLILIVKRILFFPLIEFLVWHEPALTYESAQ
jgi:hypothetical protein